MRKLNKIHFTTVIPVVLILAGLAVNFMLNRSSSDKGVLDVRAVFGGPNAFASAGKAVEEGVFSESAYSLSDVPLASPNDDGGTSFIVVTSAAVLNVNAPLSSVLPGRDGLLIYKTQRGDTLSKIASNFGISLNTILWANKNLAGNYIQPGQEIVILPVSGIIHEVREGETAESIAELYGVSSARIRSVNTSIANGIFAGARIIVPDARPNRSLGNSSLDNLPNLAGYFTLPTTGWNWGQLHPFNAVDIANACGTPVYAAQEGLVVRVGTPDGWNGGYGGLVEIQHPRVTDGGREVKTRYAHLKKSFVEVGDYVKQRELVGEMGNTGNVHGPTGCHLHFEVEGARNPLAK